MILHRLLVTEGQDKERLIPDTERSGDNGILSGHQILLHHGPQECILAGEDVRGIPPVQSSLWEAWVCTSFLECLMACAMRLPRFSALCKIVSDS